MEDGTERVTQKIPELSYVTGFSTCAGCISKWIARGLSLTDFKKNLQLMLKTAMVTDLTDRLVPAAAGTKADGARHTKIAWLVRGQFTIVNQGSRLLRSAIGFGAGQTKVETRVQVYDLATSSITPFLTFATTGGSGSEPGAILAFTTDPLEIAVGGVSGAAHGLSEDTKRTAREITAEFSDYMYKRGWISEDAWIKPKHQRGNDVW